MAFQYKREIAVTDPIADHQCQLLLTASNFDFAHAESDGRDLRFYVEEARTTPIPYWIKSWDSGAETAEVWLLTPTTSATVWVFYGDAALTAASSIHDTFLLGDDFSTYNKSVVFSSAPLFGTSMAQIGSDIYLAVTNPTAGSIVIYKTTNDGASWATEVSVETSGYGQPTIATDGTDLYIAADNTARTAVVFRKYVVSTQTLGSRITVVSGITGVSDPVIAHLSGSGSSAECWVAYRDTSGGDFRIRIVATTDSGATWGSPSTAHSETATGLNSIEDISLLVLSSSRILLSYEREVTEKGEASVRQVIWNGSSWGSASTIVDSTGTVDDEGGTYVLDANGDIGTAGDIFFVYASNKAGGASYAKNQLYRLKSTDDGDTWGSEELIWESYSNVTYSAVILSNGHMLLSATKQFGGTTSLRRLVTFQSVETGDEDWSDRNWVQVDGLAYVQDAGGRTGVRVEGSPDDSLRGFFVNTGYTGGDCIIECSAYALAGPDIRIVWASNSTGLNSYQLILRTNQAQFYKRVTGTFTQLAAPAHTIANTTWYDIKIQMSGSSPTTIKIWVDADLEVDTTDSTYSTGMVGLSTDLADEPWVCQNLRVRRFAATEPTFTVGAEEAVGGGSGNRRRRFFMAA